jgi:hypothetical protein
MQHKRKLLIALFNKIKSRSLTDAVEQMWNEGMFDQKALERLYIGSEIERRVRAGEAKTKAIEQLSEELNCSYDKVRTAVYRKNTKRI